MNEDTLQALAAFLMATSLTLLIFMLVARPPSRLENRLRDLAGKGTPIDPMEKFARRALPRMGAALMPDKPEERTRLQARLIQAGLYSRQAIYYYLGVKLLLMVVPPALGLAAAMFGLVPLGWGVIGGA